MEVEGEEGKEEVRGQTHGAGMCGPELLLELAHHHLKDLLRLLHLPETVCEQNRQVHLCIQRLCMLGAVVRAS